MFDIYDLCGREALRKGLINTDHAVEGNIRARDGTYIDADELRILVSERGTLLLVAHFHEQELYPELLYSPCIYLETSHQYTILFNFQTFFSVFK